MKTKTIELRQFDECSNELKAIILDRYRYFNVEDYDLTSNDSYYIYTTEQGFYNDINDYHYDNHRIVILKGIWYLSASKVKPK